MRHILFTPENPGVFPVALLIKNSGLRQKELENHYVNHLQVPKTDVVAFSLAYGEKGKCPASLQKEYLTGLLKALESLGTTTLYVCDSNYFKTLTNQKKAEPYYGYVLPCAIKGYEHINVVLGVNYQGLFYNPDIQQKIDLSLDTLNQHLTGNYQELGADIIHSEYYPSTYQEISNALNALHQYPELTADFEAFSLQFWKAGIGTAAFAWDQHNGLSFKIDYVPFSGETVDQKLELLGIKVPVEPKDTEDSYRKKCAKIAGDYHGYQRHNPQVKQLLREFFESYKGTLTWHNMNYDAKVAIYELWMDHPLDEVGKQKGLEIMCRMFQDTKLITYLATNSCAGNKLSLKDQAHEFAGNWAQDDIKDIRKIPLPDLLRYNLVDCLSTRYVHNKHWPTLIRDEQEEVYLRIFKPSVKMLLQIELTGMPMNMARVQEVKRELTADRDGYLDVFGKYAHIQRVEDHFTQKKWQKDFDDRRFKAKHPDKIQPKDRTTFPRELFNPNSNQQIQFLLYEYMELPVIDLTDSKQPAVGGDTIKKLIHQTKDPEFLEILQALIGFFEVDKILGTFIKAFEENTVEKDGWHYLHGNFNLGGTVSGRLSSSGPNLQNLPSTGSKYAKVIKSCFQAPPGWLFVGADFASLEDRISALTTRDPMKLKVYVDGFDGHCLRAYGYFGEKMPDIDPNCVNSINSIAKKYKAERQASKVPTFALTYGGTYIAIMGQTGLPKEAAQDIENKYHELYKVSDKWVAKQIEQATKDGYVTVAFGMRVRTPLLSQVMLGHRNTPYEAQAEGRTAGNALGQSWCMLNNRAGIDLQERTLASEFRYQILPCAHIHDAQYFMVPDDIDVVHWLNTNLGECMLWQDDPLIYHPDVPLGGELDIFYPTWKDDITLPNGATPETIREICSTSH